MRIAGFDLEADNLLENVTKVHCLSVRLFGTGKSKLFVGDDVRKALRFLDTCDIIAGHNAIAYDLMVLWKLYRWKPKARIVDTMTLSCLVHPDIEGGHSLEEWGKRVGVNKLPFEGPWDVYTEEMGTYCEGDTATLEAVYDRIRNDMRGWDWSLPERIEHQFAKDFAVQGMHGVYVDRAKAEALVASITAEMDAIAAEVEPLLPPKPGTKGQLAEVTPPKQTFKKDGHPTKHALAFWEDIVAGELNGMRGLFQGKWYPLPHDGPLYTEFPMKLADSTHMKQWLMDMGWEPTMWNYKKAKDAKGKQRYVRTDSGELIPTWPKFHDKGELCPNLENINSEFPHVKQVVRWVVIRHRRGFIQSIIDAIRPDGTVAATGWALGTPTSRVRHEVVANVPKAEEGVVLGRECRSIFAARPGRKLVGVDASGLELRCLAHYVGSPELVDIVVNGKKEDGTEIHTVLWKACDPLVPSRSIQKNVTYGWLYGASDKKLGQTAGHPDHVAEKVGREIRRRMVRAIPGLEKLMKQIERAAKQGWIKAIDGRKIEIRMKHAALNTLLQSCGSILVKMAQCYMNNKIRQRKLDAFQVISYHDEVELDSHPDCAQEAGQYFVEGLKWAGEQVGFRCPLDGEVKIGLNWADVH